MLRVDQIAKQYRQLKAVNGVSFSIQRGEIYGLLGPNGAGKSTTINMISGILKPDAGDIFIEDQNVYPASTKVKLKMGVVPQEIALYDELNAYDNLLFWGSLYHLPKSKAKERAAFLLEWIGLTDRKKDKIETYSGGMKRRVNIACALMHEPELIIMDEPTVGIDPQSRNKIFELIEELNQQGKTILFTTHYMEEAERLCNRIGIIDKGQIIAEGSLQQLKENSKIQERIIIGFENDEVPSPIQINEKFFIDTDQKQIVYASNDVNAELEKLIRIVTDAGIQISHINIQNVNLESIFLQLTGRQLRD